MTLESDNVCRQSFIKNSIYFSIIAVKSQHCLQGFDRLTPVTKLKKNGRRSRWPVRPSARPGVKK